MVERELRELNHTVTESRLDTFLQTIVGIHPRGQPKHTDRGLFGLCNIKEIVQESLAWMLREFFKVIENDDCTQWLLRFSKVPRMGQDGYEGSHDIRICYLIVVRCPCQFQRPW